MEREAPPPKGGGGEEGVDATQWGGTAAARFPGTCRTSGPGCARAWRWRGAQAPPSAPLPTAASGGRTSARSAIASAAASGRCPAELGDAKDTQKERKRDEGEAG